MISLYLENNHECLDAQLSPQHVIVKTLITSHASLAGCNDA